MMARRTQVRASAVDAPPDLPLARRLLDQADRHLASAAIKGIDPDSRYGMLYDAARKAADAALRIAGRRVTQGAGHHIAFITEAKRLLGPSQEDLWTRIDAARSVRNEMEYRAREVSRSEVDGLKESAQQAVAAARAYLAEAEASAD